MVTAIVAALGLVSSIVEALTLAGSVTGAAVAFVLLPLAAWMGWRAAVSSPAFSRWLIRGAAALAGVSILSALLGLSWPVFMAVTKGAVVAETAAQSTLVELGGAGICISAVLFGIIAAAALWDEPARSR